MQANMNNTSCLYILNDNPLYHAMFSVSVRLLRSINPEIPIQLIYVKDSNVDSWSETNEIFKSLDSNFVQKYMAWNFENIEGLVKLCNIDIRVVEKLPYRSQNFVSMQRCLFEGIDTENVLLLDVDTFIFKPIDYVFTKYKDSDIYACPMVAFLKDKDSSRVDKTEIMFSYLIENKLHKKVISPMNSGVVLFRKGLIKKYGSCVLKYCNELMYKKHPMSDMMFAVRSDGRSREEFSFNLFALENNISTDFFDETDIAISEFNPNLSIFHTGSNTYSYYFSKLAEINLLIPN